MLLSQDIHTQTIRTIRPFPLADQLQVFRRRWKVVLAAFGLVVVGTLLILARTQPAYTATGTLLYDPQAAETPGDPLAASPDPAGEDAATASQAVLLTSLSAAQAIVARLHLARLPAFNPALRPHLLPFGKPARPGPDATAIATQAALAVAVLPGSRILQVSFTAPDPALAAAGANLAMRLYRDGSRDRATAALGSAQAWLAGNSQSVQASLDQTEAALARARAAAGVVAGTQGSVTAETASGITASLVQAEAELAMNRARLASAASGDAAAANAAVAPNLLPLRKEQADLSAQVQSLQTRYGPDYPDLVAARRSLAAINAEIGDETGRELDAARTQVAADEAEVATLKQALAGAATQSAAEDTGSAPVRALEQRAAAGQAMLRAMTLQADQLAQEASLARPDATIVSDAVPPTAPGGPPHGLVLAAAAGFGLCLGLLLAGLAEALDTAPRGAEGLREALGLPCLAQLPQASEPMLAPLTAPFSLFSEQLRAIRASLGLGLPNNPIRVVAITAARPDEGKTTLTIALGRSLASAGLRVLAIDGDLRQPKFDAVFGLAGAAGFTDYLGGGIALEDILHFDPESPLHVVGAGRQARLALKLFLSPALGGFFAMMRTHYDLILLDAPPAFALAEGRVLARAADAAILCVRWGHTPRRVAQAAAALLREAGVSLTGAALTRVDPVAHGRSGLPEAEMYQPRYAGYFRHLG